MGWCCQSIPPPPHCTEHPNTPKISLSLNPTKHPSGTSNLTHPTSKTQPSQPQGCWDQLLWALWSRCLAKASQRTFWEDAEQVDRISSMSQVPLVPTRLQAHLLGQSCFGPAHSRGRFAAQAASRSQPGTTVCFGPSSTEPNAWRKCLSSWSRKLLFMHVLRPRKSHLQPACSVTW